MLLEFRAKNYKTFADELIFSMIPAPKQKGLDYSILEEKVHHKLYKVLSSAVIYGPNASGKTNIIGAMETLKYVILRGNIRNVDTTPPYSNAAANHLELVPNRLDKGGSPVEFSIKFIDNGLFFDYKLALDLGGFLDEGYARKILNETLYINERMLFSRSNHVKIESDGLKEYEADKLDEYQPSMLQKLANSNLNDEELFLTNGFKTIFSSKLVDKFLTWLDDKFMVYYRADSLQVKPAKSRKDTIFIDRTVNEAAKTFGVTSNDLGYASQEDDSEPKLVSVLGRTAVNAESFESYGTIRFVHMFPVVLKALFSGGTLVIDEFDASLHPMALMNIINIFHDDDLNKKNAQLIFNTHNPIFLNSNLFRRDEIKFVERDDETFCSTHYSLSDFGTSGDTGVRMGGDYMKKYFTSQYGALKEIDFSPIIEHWLPKEEGE